ncbi:MAG: phage holin family protein [Candidatus Promineifilaceae bacterium]|jgi:putative membrane protein
MKFNWKVALIRIPINGLVLALAALLLPGVHMERGLLSFLVLGAVFGLLNAFLRPVLQFFTLPLIFATSGLIIIIINAVLLWVLELILPSYIHYDGFMAILVAALIVGLLVLIMESLFGVTPPIIDRTLISADRSQE